MKEPEKIIECETDIECAFVAHALQRIFQQGPFTVIWAEDKSVWLKCCTPGCTMDHMTDLKHEAEKAQKQYREDGDSARFDLMIGILFPAFGR